LRRVAPPSPTHQDVAALRCGPFWFIFFIRSPYIHLAIGQQPPGLPSKHYENWHPPVFQIWF
jgi:hypothetical protein